MHLHKFLQNELFYDYLQPLINRLYILDSPLECCSFSVKWRKVLSTFLSPKWFNYVQSREMLTGAPAIHKLLSTLDIEKTLEYILDKWDFFNRYEALDQYKITAKSSEDFLAKWRPKAKNKVYFLNAAAQSKKNTIVKRFSLIKKMSLEGSNPAWTVLFNLPVLPPDLRPIMKLKDGQIILSDLNELYRIILTRNLAISQLSSHNLAAMVQKVLLQRAVDALLGNGIGNTFRDLDNHPYKSISDILTGKEGRLRENLLGKRVDYSGRSVIVVGPQLSLYQCGLPKEMAIELFQPFVIYYLIHFKLARSPRAAKHMIQKRVPIIWTLLQKVIENHYIILNRAPTLHRLGIQAFQPILVSERAIHLHPLVCAGFNADFDGDQMAVHIPLSLAAQAEACMLMSPYFNLLSPATGEAIAVPSQDMLLGLYILTLETNLGVYKFISKESYNLNSITCHKSTDIFGLLEKHKNNQGLVWLAVKPTLKVTSHTGKEEPIEIQYNLQGYCSKIYEYAEINFTPDGYLLSQYIRTTLGRILFNQQIEQAIQGTSQLSVQI
jgi:DNA-directed RNA polymerase subunit beta'